MAPVTHETFPLELLEIDEPIVELHAAWLDDVSVPDLRDLSDEEPGDAFAVERADGGLWLCGGHSHLTSVFPVGAGRWGWATDGGA